MIVFISLMDEALFMKTFMTSGRKYNTKNKKEDNYEAK